MNAKVKFAPEEIGPESNDGSDAESRKGHATLGGLVEGEHDVTVWMTVPVLSHSTLLPTMTVADAGLNRQAEALKEQTASSIIEIG